MTTIFYPDVSNYQAGLKIQAATVAVIAKATQGTSSVDASYGNFKSQAAAEGSLFCAYHFLTAGSAPAQASHAFSVVGSSVPLMVDMEPDGSSKPTIADLQSFIQEYRALGGTVVEVYLPPWYWSDLGKPDLTFLATDGISLVTSNYSSYSDTSTAWNAYGGVAPTQWQFTDAFSYGGEKVDFNAFKGTVQELAALWKIDAPVTKPIANPVPVADTSECRAKHNTFTPIAEDGNFGTHSWQAAQFVLGVATDGNPGPVTKKALQKILGVTQDGNLGPVSVKALQKKVGATQDGQWGKNTSKAFQTYLNKGLFY